MKSDELKHILKKAKEIVPKPDAIIDLYDLTFIWVSDKVIKKLGYSSSEIVGKRTASVCKNQRKNIQKTQMEIMNHREGVTRIEHLKTKDGKLINFKIKDIYFEYGENPYSVSKVLNITNDLSCEQ